MVVFCANRNFSAGQLFNVVFFPTYCEGFYFNNPLMAMQCLGTGWLLFQTLSSILKAVVFFGDQNSNAEITSLAMS